MISPHTPVNLADPSFLYILPSQIICDIFVGVGVGRDIPDYLLCPHGNNSFSLNPIRPAIMDIMVTERVFFIH